MTAEDTMIIISAMITSLSRKFPSERNNENLQYLRDAYATLGVFGDKNSSDDIGVTFRCLAEILNQEADNLRDESHQTIVER